MDTLPPPIVDLSHLDEPVRRACNGAPVEIVDWRLDTIQPQWLGTNSGVYRAVGTAIAGATTRDWSLILKVLIPPARREDPALTAFYDGDPGNDPGSLLYWKREALIYDSGLLLDLPGGLRAPRCYGLHEPAADETWLWLEDIVDSSPPHWTVDEYADAAATLGRFNGAYLLGRALPQAPWLPTDWLRSNLARAAPAMERLPEHLDDAFVRRRFRPDVYLDLLRVWEGREALLAALDRLPQTFCHHDAHRFNLFRRGDDELVAIDWSASGQGPIGEEAGLLAGVTVLYQMVDLLDAAALDARIFAGYVAGLRQAGWHGDERLVRLGYTAEMALKIVIAYLPGMLWSMLDHSWHADYEAHSGSTIAALADAQADCTRWLLDRGLEALELARQL